MVLEQPAVRVPPHPRPADGQSRLLHEASDHRDVDVVEVDFTVADPALVGAPVLPEVADDAAPEGVGGVEVGDRGRFLDCAVGDGY